MSWFSKSTGNSAEDKMSDAVGCMIIAAAVVVLCVIAGIVLLVRWLV